MTDKRFVDCECWHYHVEGCPNYVPIAAIRARYAAIAAGTQRAEPGETPARAEGCQSGPKGIAQPSGE